MGVYMKALVLLSFLHISYDSYRARPRILLCLFVHSLLPNLAEYFKLLHHHEKGFLPLEDPAILQSTLRVHSKED